MSPPLILLSANSYVYITVWATSIWHVYNNSRVKVFSGLPTYQSATVKCLSVVHVYTVNNIVVLLLLVLLQAS
jgi:hypothetical protein